MHPAANWPSAHGRLDFKEWAEKGKRAPQFGYPLGVRRFQDVPGSEILARDAGQVGSSGAHLFIFVRLPKASCNSAYSPCRLRWVVHALAALEDGCQDDADLRPALRSSVLRFDLFLLLRL